MASKKEAVCFTAGLNTAVFSWGLIHAYLASDREAPAIAAGISTGALSAAAMQRCYKDLLKAEDARRDGKATAEDVEVARWKWFRRFLAMASDRPLSVLWDGLPDQSDFFAELPPIKDSAAALFVPEYGAPPLAKFQKEAVKRDYEESESDARRELFLYVKLGRWFAKSPVPVSSIADLLVKRVRAKERYPGPKLWRILLFWFRTTQIFLRLCIHGFWHPEWFPEFEFASRGWQRFYIRPLFGWGIYLGIFGFFAAVPLGLIVFFLLQAAHQLNTYVHPSKSAFDWVILRNVVEALSAQIFVALAYVARLIRWVPVPLIVIVLVAIVPPLRRWASRKGVRLWRTIRGTVLDVLTSFLKGVSRYAAKQLSLEKHIVHPYHLRSRLVRLFGNGGLSPTLDEKPFPILLVTSPLEQLDDRIASQLWAQELTPLVDALSASLALPGLFSPVMVATRSARKYIRQAILSASFWLKPGTSVRDLKSRVLNLVDGAVVRRNPLPALFKYLTDDRNHHHIADTLISTGEHDARVHVVYGQPLGENSGAPASGNMPDIVDVARKGLRLQNRRDTDLEILQTNFTSKLEWEIRKCTAVSSIRDVWPIFADAIAPETEVSFGRSPLNPPPEGFYRIIADGCRRSLEKLYQSEIAGISNGRDHVPCSELLQSLSGDKFRRGLPEICQYCPKVLSPQKKTNHDAAWVDKTIANQFVHGAGGAAANAVVDPGRIVFIASGGVFRGSFHGGMIGAMLAGQIRPQLIVGASVGTLMGGTLGAIFSRESYDDSIRLLLELVDLLLHVDEQIAFTKTFKNAVREIGIRGKSIRLSPRQLSKDIAAGARSDPAFALSGAPSVLIDAISDLLMIPHDQTTAAAANFVSGHVTKAVEELLKAIKSETLRRLDIRYSLIGISLLEPAARRLINADIDLSDCQPFAPHIAFVCTATNLNTESLLVLGRSNEPSYDFVQAALASSAFPAVFSPRRESDVLPGTGEVTTYYSDGGMFDNLPFLPAIGTLGEIQRAYADQAHLDPIDYLRKRHRSPDLFLVGSLDVQPSADENRYGPFDDLVDISKRAKLLQNNVKIDGFIDSSKRIHAQLDVLLGPRNQYSAASDPDFVNGIVDAATLPIYPSDDQHLNPTFAFCASTGFRPERVTRSIADGCFQTFRGLAEQYARNAQHADGDVLGRSLAGLKNRRLPSVEWNRAAKRTGSGNCPFFLHSADIKASYSEKRFQPALTTNTFTCPFYRAWQLGVSSGNTAAAETALAIHEQCKSDKQHTTAQPAVSKGTQTAT